MQHEPAVTTNPKVMHGTPCFAGTRVPVYSFFEHLKLGCSVDEFLEDFPSVKREQIDAVLDQANEVIQQQATLVTATK